MIPIPIKENKLYQKVCHICKKEFNIDDNDKVRDHCHFTGKYRRAAHNACNLNYKAAKEIHVRHNGSTYDFHFIIKELAEERKGLFQKIYNVSVPIKNDKQEDNYKWKLIDGFRFMSTSQSSFVNIFCDRLDSDKCDDCKSCLEYMSIKDDQLIFRCFECKKKKVITKILIKI